MARFNNKTSTVYLETPSGDKSVRIGPGPGDFNIDNFEAGNIELVEVRDRDDHEGFVDGPSLVQAFSITIGNKKEAVTSDTAHRIYDAINKTGWWADAESADPDAWCLVIRVVLQSGTTTTGFRLPKCRIRGAFQVANAGNTWNITGNNYLAPTPL